MKKIFIISLFVWAFINAFAQNPSNKKLDGDYEAFKRQAQQKYNAFRESAIKEYNDYRDKVNAEFAGYVRKKWKSFPAFEGIPVPKEPKPVVPPKIKPKKLPTADPIPFKKIKPVPATPVVKPQPIAPIPPSPRPTPVKSRFAFRYYGVEGKVSLDASHLFSLRNASEKSVADAWVTLSNSRYNDLLNDCLTLRKDLNLCDWGYMEMLKTLSEKFFGKPCNEAVLLEMFILSQSGYQIRIARAGARLVLLVPFLQDIYQYVYVTIDGKNYYVLDKSFQGGGQFNVLNHEFPKEQQASLKITQPNFPFVATPAKTFASQYNRDLQVSISTNKNLIDFYNTYPLSSEWNLYSQASLSDRIKADLYPALHQQIAGKREKEAANILLEFVQTAFKYQTDEQQFGYERPLFADESFFYPAIDCEDRSILFAVLIRDLLHLDVLLLRYPGHLATAVQFNENVQGDYLTVRGKKFIVCDPTYIGSNVGVTMPQFKTTSAQIVKN
jgi:hypothetical protein